MKRGVVALAVVFLAFHLPYLPASLEDLDSINFAFGIHEFDVAKHNPHPPGYPFYILLARGAYRLAGSEPRALGAISVAAGALGVLAIAALFRRMGDSESALLATLIAITAPLYWFTGARPLSDMAGLAAAVGVQALILDASTARDFARAAFIAALAVGFRSQVAWLTAPLLLYRIRIRPPSSAGFFTLAAAYAAGALAWLVPLVIVSGGPAAYWRALSVQGADDLSGIRMLWTTPTPREAIDALYYAFVSPWAAWMLGAVMLGLAAIGVVYALRQARPSLALIAVAFGPYLAFDVLFQETVTTRYALPLVIPIAYLAAVGARALPRRSGVVVAVLAAMFAAHVGGTSVAAYARQPAPAFRLFGDLYRAAREAGSIPRLAMDQREALDLRKPMVWARRELPVLGAQLPSPRNHEWLEPVKLWNDGGVGAAGPVWFIADPRRTDIDLIQHGAPMSYRWPLPYPILIGGARPGEMDWYRLDRPDWYLEDGWSLTPESAGVSAADGRGLAAGAIEGRISKRVLTAGALVIGGRNLEAVMQPQLTIAVADLWRQTLTLRPGAFAGIYGLPVIDTARLPDYVPISVTSTPPARVAIEQFDAASSRPLLAFGDGWYEPEFNDRIGRWRWLGAHGELAYVVRWPADPGGRAANQVVLHVEGESPRTYFPRGSRLVTRIGDRVLDARTLDRDFSFEVALPPELSDFGARNVLTLETDQTFVPADRWWPRTKDRRRLGLRILKCELWAATGPTR